MERASHIRVGNILSYATASFAMTFTRLIIALWSALAILNQSVYAKEITIFGILFIMIFDYYDGKLFNKSFLKEQKLWRLRRRIADSVVDRLVIQIVCIPLLISNKAFFWVYASILAREIAISGYNAVEKIKERFIIYPGPISKLACVMVGVVTIAFLTTEISILALNIILMLGMVPFAFREYQQKVAQYKATHQDDGSTTGLVEIF